MRYRQILKDSFHLTGSSSLNVGLNLARIVLLARVLGAEDFGLFALAYNTAGFFGEIVLPKFEEAVGRFLAEYRAESHERANQLVAASLLIVAFAAIGLLIIVGASLRLITEVYYHKPRLWLPFLLCLPMILINPLRRLVASHLKVLQRFKPISLALVIQPCLNLVFLVGIFALGGRLAAVVMVHVLTSAVMLIFLTWTLRDAFVWRWHVIPRSVWFFWAPLCPTGFTASIYRWLPLLLIGYFFSADDVALFEVARQGSGVLMMLTTPFREVAYAAFLNTFYQSRDSFQALFNRVLREYGSILFFVVGIGIFLAPLALPFLLGAQYAEVIYLFQLLLLAGAFGSLILDKAIVYLHNKSHYQLFISIILLLIQAALLWIACRTGDLEGVGYALVIVQLVAGISAFGIIVYLERFLIEYKSLSCPATLCGGLLMLWTLVARGFLHPLITVCLFVGLFGVTLVLFQVIPMSNLSTMRSYVLRLTGKEHRAPFDSKG